MRYITLLMLGEEPDRIVALTFSRKAAGEIFDRIMQMLGDALTSDKAFEQLQDAQPIPVTQEMVLDTTRRILHQLPRLRIGTLDSFAVSIVRAFPMELGIAHEFELMDDGSAAADDARQTVFTRIFHQPMARKDRALFIEAYKQATFGQEGKQIFKTLNDFLTAHHNLYRTISDECAWGRAARIWPNGSPWFEDSPEDVRTVGDALLAEVAALNYDEKDQARWQTWINRFVTYQPRSDWTILARRVEKLVETSTTWLPEEAKHPIEGKSFHLTDTMQELCLRLLQHLIRVDFATSLETTRGLYRVIHQYDGWYDKLVRQRGRLTFSDIQFLLLDPETQAGRCSTVKEEGRLFINYRLDGTFDHWLLDEFQDTSDLQWSILKPLVSESVQDPSGRRTFFYVGDAKQAIYGWRGGNMHLFQDIANTYAGALEHTSLPKSRRSPAEIIDVVNRIFDLPLPSFVNPGAAEVWSTVWEKHTTAVSNAGYVAWLQPEESDKHRQVCRDNRYAVVAAMLQRIQPHRRGLSVGILVRKNQHASDLVAVLRRACPELAVVQDGPAELLNNELGQLLVALVTLAAHPGDKLAWMHLHMSPLTTWIKIGTRSDLVIQIMDEIHEYGYHHLFQTWCERLDSVHPLGAYGRQVRDALFIAAAEFDRTGQKQSAMFLKHLRGYTMRYTAGSTAVRVMTLHQSKGLGFDVVVLPELQDSNVQRVNQTTMLVKAGEPPGSIDWVLKPPRKILAQQDAALTATMATNESERLFDTMCGFYVAMTRAKKALLFVTTPRANYESNASEARWIEETFDKEVGHRDEWAGVPLQIRYEAGNPQWFEEIDVVDKVPQSSATSPHLVSSTDRRRPRQVRPSHESKEVQQAGRLFSELTDRARTLGDAVHELLAQIKWLDDVVESNRTLEQWSAESRFADDIRQDAMELVRHAVRVDQVIETLTHPGGHVEVWRERSFDVLFEQDWVSGTFDRVTLTGTSPDQVTSATIIDFKSNDVITDGELQRWTDHYRPQLELYRKVLSKMVDLEQNRIELKLIFIKPAVVVSL